MEDEWIDGEIGGYYWPTTNMELAYLIEASPTQVSCVLVFDLGAVFLPASLFYLLGTSVFGSMATRLGRWLSSLIGE